MDLMKHDLAHEFPEQLDQMRQLKVDNAHFSKICARYEECNHRIQKYEQGDGAISDDALEELKKERLQTKDEINAMLTAA